MIHMITLEEPLINVCIWVATFGFAEPEVPDGVEAVHVVEDADQNSIVRLIVNDGNCLVDKLIR